jgi:hypothetical protein
VISLDTFSMETWVRVIGKNHLTWVSAEEPRAQATSLVVGALHWSQIP